MLLSELKQNIVNKEMDDFYMFCGEEIKIMDTYINMIVKTFGLEPVRVDKLSDVYSKLTTRSLTNTKKCYIISHDEEYVKADEKVWKTLQGLAMQSVIIMIYSKLDKRTKFYKDHEDLLTEFDVLAPEILTRYIQKEIPLSSEYCEELIGICEGSYNRILMEVDKLKCLANAKNTNVNSVYNLAIEEGVIYVPTKELLFPFIDAVTKADLKQSYLIWNKIRKIENSMAILSLLYSNFRNILSVQLAGNVKGICEFTGLTPFQVKLAKDKLGYFNRNELINILKKVRWTEKGIKTGKIEEPMAIDYVLTQIFNGEF